MTKKASKIGMGGGCHWCTEAVFNVLKGVYNVEQGYILAHGENSVPSEGVIIHYIEEEISLFDLIQVHLHTHAATSAHSFRKKYRSAVYSFESEEIKDVEHILNLLQVDFKAPIITKALLFHSFEASRESLRQYYEKHPDAPFCERYIIPKLNLIKQNFIKWKDNP